ncbi:MAG: class II aldolase/adducin family protein [Coriobacteriales bacterium]|nr:class II aldolase/adducin family protein [Coriobacteriales bacterium]
MSKKNRAAKASKQQVSKKKSKVKRGAKVPFETERRSLIDCALAMRASSLIKGSGGNVSMRIPGAGPEGKDAFLVTPTAMDYDTMLPSDVVLVDEQGITIDGKRRPTSDMAAVLYIFNHLPQVNVVIHTHQPYATALGLVVDELPADFTTVIDELHAAVHVAPFTRSSDEGMGVLTVEHLGDALAVILKHHGVIAVGKSIDQALTAAVYLEESCQAYIAALATNLPIAHLTPEQIADEAEERGYYGQPEE